MLRTNEPIPIPLLGAAAGETLSMARIDQGVMTQWCWAACTLMVLRHRGDGGTTLCSIVNFGLGRSDCCAGASASGPCNMPVPVKSGAKVDISAVFARFGIHAAFTPGQVAFETLQSEIHARRPVEVFFQWSPNGHVALVQGWEPDPSGGDPFVHVCDPQFGQFGKVRFQSLRAAYGMGAWAATFTGIA